MNDPDFRLLLAIVVVTAIAAAGWYFRDELLPQPQEPVATAPEAGAIEVKEDAGPRHPISPPDPADSGSRSLVPLPPLDDSDAYFMLALVNVFGAGIEPLLVKDALIDRIVSSVDNLPRGHVAEKIRPVGRLPDFFWVESVDGNGPTVLSADNYQRYAPLVEQIASADVDSVVETYRRFYPLFQQAYERLGYPDRYFNDRVVEVIDHLLATPRPEGPIYLVRPHVLYEFADRDLEALSSGQKMLLRVGPDNAATVKEVLSELRARLAS